MLAFRSTNFQHIIRLTEVVINSRPHSSLWNYSPIEAHFSTHASSEIARLNTLAFQQHQNEAISHYLKSPRQQRISINSKVRIRRKRNVFRKESPLFHSIWSDNVYIVSKIDRSVFPFVYYMENLSKGFYSFQLLLLSPHYPIDEYKNSSKTSKIIVIDFEKVNDTSYLRSGRVLPSRHDIKYKIVKDGETQYVSAADLQLFTKLYGKNVLHYSHFFKNPNNVSYVI